MDRSAARFARWRTRLLVVAVLVILPLITTSLAIGEGSRTLFPTTVPDRFRSHLEWTARTYGGGDSPVTLARRTLLRLYAQAGEEILLGSSGIDVSGIDGGEPNQGDILVFNPGTVSGPIGQEVLPTLSGAASPPQPGAFANGFSCTAQRDAVPGVGRISSRAEELAGPLPNPGGYNPCVYVAPVTGLYFVAFIGPSGPNSTTVPVVSGSFDPTPSDVGPLQYTSVTAWDATVRNAGVEQPGRLFAYYYTAITGGGARPVTGSGYVVTNTGFRYRVTFTGDPFGFLFYANQLGFQINRPGQPPLPLYRALVADPAASFNNQNGLIELQGNGEVSLSEPTYPLFGNEPDPLVLDALGIPRTAVAPRIEDLRFTSTRGDGTTGINEGGTFSFTTTQPGVYTLVISRAGATFDPTDPQNRTLRGIAEAPGLVSVAWDGRDNSGIPFPAGEFQAQAVVQDGEVHFPFVDVENNVDGGPILELINPPDTNDDGVGDCPDWNGGCFGAFYDDRGYRTPSGVLVGQAVDGPLCPGDAANPNGFGNPPAILASDPVLGFDTRSNQRAFGFPFDANPPAVCRVDGGHGDKKGLDLWTFYPSNTLTTPLRIVDPTAVTLRNLSATRTAEGVTIHWATGSELNTQGFHILRSESGALEDAVYLTSTPIPARGSALGGERYSWTDTTPGYLGRTVAYWLEEVETTGVSQRFGPVRPTAPLTIGRYQVGLPLVRR